MGCFGSAGAAAALAAPGDTQAMRHALATAASLAAGLQQAFRSDAMTKALHAGHAAWVGVGAGLGAAAGLTGAPDVLEGDAGFGAALACDPQWSLATEGLGSSYNIMAITQKKHACCGHTFAAIDAVLELRAQHAIAPAQVEAIEVATYRAALDVAGNPEPRSVFEAKFSLPYVVCRALLSGTVRLGAFEPAQLIDPAARALMRRVRLVADPELSAGFPRMRAARVTLTLRDGRVLQHFAPYRKGDPEAPLSDAELDEKFAELAGPVIGRDAAGTLLQRLWQVDRLPLSALHLQEL